MQARFTFSNIRLLAVVSLLALGAASGRLVAAEGGDSGQPKSDPFSLFHTPWAVRTFNVRCDLGQSLRYVLILRARAGDRVRVHGSCNERIEITQDRLTLEGVDGGAIDGAGLEPGAPEFNPLVVIEGAQGVVLENLTIRNSSAEGLIARSGAAVTMRNVTATANANLGMLIDNARVEMDNSTVSGNGSGLDAINNSSLVFTGAIDLTQNGALGLGSANGTALELRGAQVDASGNGAFGAVIEGATLGLFNFGVSQGSSLTADDNGMFGIVVTAGGLIDIIAPPPFYNSGINVISASGNGTAGMYVLGQSTVESPFGAATLRFEDNPVGVQVDTNSSMLIVGGMQISGNADVGLLADGAGSVTIIPPEADPTAVPSAITGNGTDVRLSFGTRATIAAAVGSIVCDPSVLVRGSAMCP